MPNKDQTSNTKPTIADILDKKKPMEAETEVLLDPEYQDKISELERKKIEAQRAERQGKTDISMPPPSRYDEMIDELYEEAREHVVTFRFRDIGRKRLDELARQHPPTEEQKKQYRELGAPGVLEYNVDTFGPELVAASCIEPELSVDDARRIFDEWSAAEVDNLFGTALRACRGRASIPLSKRGTGTTPTSD